MFEVILGYFTNIGEVLNSFMDFIKNLFSMFGGNEESTSAPNVEEDLLEDTLYKSK